MEEMGEHYQICTRCVMDTSDPDIVFDEQGICNHCHAYDLAIQKQVFSGEAGKKILDSFVKKVKNEGLGKEYDCIIGVSGGVDSSYVAYLVHELGLRPLAVHLDNGWDSEIAVKNIELLLNKLGIELYTYVLDWEEFRDLQLAFLRASTPDSEIPSDHAIVSSIYMKAKDMGINNIIVGYNVRTESHLPRAWSHGHFDWRYISSINKIYGTKPLKNFPHMTFWQHIYYAGRFNWFPILNYIDYSKTEARKVLEEELGWRYYGGKHYESIYTRFYQGYILPNKFGYDKRRTHLSSLVCSGEITRAKALEELNNDPYPAAQMRDDKEFVVKKFEFTEEDFNNIMALPRRSFYDYPSYEKIIRNPLWFGLVKMAYHSIYLKGKSYAGF
jgi:N-acetyl sugar amidotransferase